MREYGCVYEEKEKRVCVKARERERDTRAYGVSLEYRFRDGAAAHIGTRGCVRNEEVYA